MLERHARAMNASHIHSGNMLPRFIGIEGDMRTNSPRKALAKVESNHEK